MDGNNFNNNNGFDQNSDTNFGYTPDQNAGTNYGYTPDQNAGMNTGYTPDQNAYSSPTYNYNTASVSEKSGGNGLAIASLICGIAATVLFCVPCIYMLMPLSGIAGIVLGIIGLKKGQNKGMCIAGIICGGLGALLSSGYFIFSVVFAVGKEVNSFKF